MQPTPFELLATSIFGLAILHTFAAKQFERYAHKSTKHAGVLHLLGEVEVIFGFWAFVLMAVMASFRGFDEATDYVESRDFAEPLFVFAIMVVSASKPVLHAAERLMHVIATRLPMRATLATVWLGLAAVPLLGSLITEPAAMTIAALMLAPVAFRTEIPEMPKYFALGALFVNISIGGTLSSYAAPPILMVAKTWSWDTFFMLSTFGWKAALAVLCNATMAAVWLRSHLAVAPPVTGDQENDMPVPVVLVHLALLAGIVLSAHHPVIFIGLLLMFLGFAQAYERFQNPLLLREALLVGFFLAGLVVLGGFQRWWIQPAIAALDEGTLFLAALGLTAVTDNAALTYLGSLSGSISDESKYWLVAGAVAGGGLTVIANAPNPAGISLLKKGFSDETISALGLLAGALLPTAIAALAFVAL
ncbi:putative Na+/H+ antiporter [Lysobacter niastensis]|uniref:Na+/H+ antiporter n=1 Tax=Lysobacter niastensis TaxID=380629 RepID=A0ABS0B7V5_9GAMM|nr:putative Na+/H+ antiporter [Lysobacter niastensis]MBF6024917.1 putative Na+/H+ antiporter [Lysobacter niastensis]